MENLMILLATPQDKGAGYTTLIMLLLIMIIFWFFFIRPQVKKNKELRKFRENLTKGQRIITIGGIHGKILEIKDNTVIIESEGQTKLRVEKSAIVAEFKPEQIKEENQ